MAGKRRVRDWQAIDPHLRQHPMFLELVMRLGTTPVAAHGLLAGLWAFAFSFAQDGDLSRFSAKRLALVVGWEGDAEDMLTALTEIGFVTDGQLHDWHDWGGRLFAERDAEAERKRKASADIRGETRSIPEYGPEERRVEKRKKETEQRKRATDDLFERFWSRWPHKHGGKKLARERFARLSAKDQGRVLEAEGHLVRASQSGRLTVEFQPRAENFIGGQKEYWREWANGPPAKYAAGSTERARRLCPECGTALTFDERGGQHCPMCDWRPKEGL